MGVRKTSSGTRSPLLCKPSTGPQDALPRHADPIARPNPAKCIARYSSGTIRSTRLSHGFVWRVAEQGLGAGVPEADAAVRAGVDDRRMAVAREGRAKSFEVRERRHSAYSFDRGLRPRGPSA